MTLFDHLFRFLPPSPELDLPSVETEPEFYIREPRDMVAIIKALLKAGESLLKLPIILNSTATTSGILPRLSSRFARLRLSAGKMAGNGQRPDGRKKEVVGG